MRITDVALWLCLVVTLSPMSARADCIEQTRRIDYDGTNAAPIKSYLCSTEEVQRIPQIKVELHRLSNAAMSPLKVC